MQTDQTAPAVAIVTYVNAGYFDESDDETGIAHVLEHMYFKGTPTRGVGEIAKQTKAAGGHLNAHTIYDNTVYYTVLPSSALERGLRIQSDAYANSLIDREELARELEVIIEEAKRKADNPSAVATETLFELLHDRHRIRRWRIGREAGLRGLTSERMHSFYRKYYRPANTVLSISGDVDAGETMRLVESLYGNLPGGIPDRDRGPSEPEHTGFRYRELSGDVGQSQVVIGWRTPAALHPDTPRLDFVASILGEGRASRLYRSVRERRLAAYVSAGNHTPTELGVFVVHAESDPAKAASAMSAIWSDVNALASATVGKSELDRVRSMFDAHWARRLETAQGRAMYLAEWESMGGWKLGDEYRAGFISTTSDDVNRVVAEYLSLDRAAALIYRPNSASAVANDSAEMERLLKNAAPGGDLSSPNPVALSPLAPVSDVVFVREEAGVSVFRSANGVPILVRRKAGSPIAHIAAHGIGGAVNDGPARAGLTLIAARTMLKGTTSLTSEQIAQATESLGASLGASAGTESFGWSMSVPTPRFGEALALFGDVIVNPAFGAEAMETERRVALSNLALIRDDMMRYPIRMLTAAAFPSHPYGIPASGTEDSLASLTVDDLRNWHSRNVLRSPMAIGIVADIEPREAARMAAAALQKIEPSDPDEIAPPKWTDSPRTVSEDRDKAQTALALAFPGPSRSDHSRWAAHLLGTIASGLGGRFFDELRDKRSLAYTVHLSARDLRLGGMFIAYIATSPGKEDEARSALLAEFERLRAAEVSEEELARAKDFVIGSHAISQESGGNILGEMLDAWLFGAGLSELASYDDSVRAVTAAEIQRLAKESFKTNELVEAVVRGVERTV
ncbi:MAG: insulinase family protein [Gemmatimonadota bacterium]|nr:insulinase family protein [Gemmatimonadota bacterium]